MKNRAEHIVCAVATANGFAMPYRSVAAEKESEPRGKDMLPRVAIKLPEAKVDSRPGD